MQGASRVVAVEDAPRSEFMFGIRRFYVAAGSGRTIVLGLRRLVSGHLEERCDAVKVRGPWESWRVFISIMRKVWGGICHL